MAHCQVFRHTVFHEQMSTDPEIVEVKQEVIDDEGIPCSFRPSFLNPAICGYEQLSLALPPATPMLLFRFVKEEQTEEVIPQTSIMSQPDNPIPIFSNQKEIVDGSCPWCPRSFASIKGAISHASRSHKREYAVNKKTESRSATKKTHRQPAIRAATDSSPPVLKALLSAPFDCLPCVRSFKNLSGLTSHIRGKAHHASVANTADCQNTKSNTRRSPRHHARTTLY